MQRSSIIENSVKIPTFEYVKLHNKDMENMIDRVLLWLTSLNLVDRMVAVTAIMLGAVFTGALIALTLMGILCLIA